MFQRFEILMYKALYKYGSIIIIFFIILPEGEVDEKVNGNIIEWNWKFKWKLQ